MIKIKENLNIITQLYIKLKMKNNLKRLYDSLCYYAKYTQEEINTKKKKVYLGLMFLKKLKNYYINMNIFLMMNLSV